MQPQRWASLVGSILIIILVSACSSKIIIIKSFGNGSVAKIEANKDSIFDGKALFYRPDKKTLWYSSAYKKGKQYGYTKFYNKQGVLVEEGLCVDDILEAPEKFKQGKWIYYNDKGQKIETQYHLETFVYKEQVYFYPNGRIESIIKLDSTRICLNLPPSKETTEGVLSINCGVKLLPHYIVKYDATGRILEKGQFSNKAYLITEKDSTTNTIMGYIQTVKIGKWIMYNDTIKQSVVKNFGTDNKYCYSCQM